MELSGIPWFRVHGIILNDPGRLISVHLTHTAVIAGWAGSSVLFESVMTDDFDEMFNHCSFTQLAGLAVDGVFRTSVRVWFTLAHSLFTFGSLEGHIGHPVDIILGSIFLVRTKRTGDRHTVPNKERMAQRRFAKTKATHSATSEIPTGDRSIWDILEDAKWHPDMCPTEHLLDLEFWIQEVLARRQMGSDKASKPA